LVNINELFDKIADKSKLNNNDTLYLGKIMIKAGGDTAKAVSYLAIGLKKDTSKADDIRGIAKEIFDIRAYVPASVLFKAIVDNIGKVNNLDWYNLGRSYFYANDYPNADATFAKNYELFPNFHTALYYRALSQYIVDKDGSKGLAVPYFEQYVEKETDKVKYKTYFVRAFNACGSFYSTVKKNKAKAEENYKKTLEVDPANASAKEGLKYTATLK